MHTPNWKMSNPHSGVGGDVGDGGGKLGRGGGEAPNPLKLYDGTWKGFANEWLCEGVGVARGGEGGCWSGKGWQGAGEDSEVSGRAVGPWGKQRW